MNPNGQHEAASMATAVRHIREIDLDMRHWGEGGLTSEQRSAAMRAAEYLALMMTQRQWRNVR